MRLADQLSDPAYAACIGKGEKRKRSFALPGSSMFVVLRFH